MKRSEFVYGLAVIVIGIVLLIVTLTGCAGQVVR